MSHTRLRPTFSFTDEKLAELKRIAPEAFADGRVNWEVLKEALGEHADDESAEAEHFGLNWPGKRDARRMAGTPSTGALVPKPGDGVNEDTTRNIFIEGENLEVLKLLQKAYRGKVKMIYIDPPYNTGNDFVYEDDFTEPLEEYLRRTGQVDEEGKALTTNTRADGRFHSKWLSMMYPRLRLARQLLRDDGVIFVSIDDNEVHHLRTLLNEVFGEENFAAEIIPITNPRGRTLDKFIAKTHEYLLVFSRTTDAEALFQIKKSEKGIADYTKKDARGMFRLLELRNRNPVFDRSNRPNLYYPLYVNPKTEEVSLTETATHTTKVLPLNSKDVDGCWTWGKDKVDNNIDLLVGRQVNTGAWRIFRKDYLEGSSMLTKAKSVWATTDVNHEQGKEAVGKLLGKTLFDFPKSVELVKKCLQIGTVEDKDHIVLDFFAGSGTTGHAVHDLNQEDEGNRTFILVQLPEKLAPEHPGYKDGYRAISDVTKERLRRALKPGGSGFKSFNLNHSNYRAWKDYHGTDAKALEDLFAAQETPLREGWSVEGLTTEVMLLEGFPLDSRVEVQKAFRKNTVQRIHHEWHQHALFVCLDKKIHAETIAALVLGEGDTFICLDTAIDDQSKLRLSDKGMIKTI